MIEPSTTDLDASPESVQAWVEHLLVAVHEFDSDLGNASAKANTQAAEIARLWAALDTLLDRYVEVASGDGCYYDPEKEPHVIAARAALETQP